MNILDKKIFDFFDFMESKTTIVSYFYMVVEKIRSKTSDPGSQYGFSISPLIFMGVSIGVFIWGLLLLNFVPKVPLFLLLAMQATTFIVFWKKLKSKLL